MSSPGWWSHGELSGQHPALCGGEEHVDLGSRAGPSFPTTHVSTHRGWRECEEGLDLVGALRSTLRTQL